MNDTTAASRRTRPHGPNNKKAAKRRWRERREGWKACHFLSRLPPEVRNLIYEHIFTPSPVIQFIKSREKHHYVARRSTKGAAGPTTVRNSRVLGKYSRYAGLQTLWRTSISGIVLANKQTYRESLGYLYALCTFEFGPVRLARDFLRVVKKENLLRIRRVRSWHEFPSPGTEANAVPHQNRIKADETFLELCALIAHRLPNITTLEARHTGALPKPSSGLRGIMASTLSRSAWALPLKQLMKPKRLTSFTLSLAPNRKKSVKEFFDQHKGLTLPGIGALSDKQVRDMAGNWASWNEIYCESFAVAVQNLMLTQDEESAWKDHLKLAEGYLQWTLDPMASYETYLPLKDVEDEFGAEESPE
jgi:hypothetical protein